MERARLEKMATGAKKTAWAGQKTAGLTKRKDVCCRKLSRLIFTINGELTLESELQAYSQSPFNIGKDPLQIKWS